MILEDFGLYYADVMWTDLPIVETRPVLVADNKMFVFYYVTSKVNNERYIENGYLIKDWEKCNLKCPSVIRLDRKVDLTVDKFKEYIGTLTANDINGFLLALTDYKIKQSLGKPGRRKK